MARIYEYLDANADMKFHTITEILNDCFGTDYKVWRKATWPNYHGGTGGFRVWFPKLAKEVNGEYVSAAFDCLNTISSDGNEIVFEKLNDCSADVEEKYHGYDLVFAKASRDEYRFRGVFIRNEEKSYPHHDVSKRIAAKVQLVGDPVEKIVILDDDFETPEQKLMRIQEAASIEKTLNALALVGEEKRAVVSVRINQNKFREHLIKRYGKCCLCSVDEPDLLVASHIKPWDVATPEERLDTDNGLLLCPNHDKLFDKGYISFDAAGRIRISDLLSADAREAMSIRDDMEIRLNRGNQTYLCYHNKYVFKK